MRLVAATDPRLATISKGLVVPVDELGAADLPVAKCLGEHLPTLTLITVAATQDGADAISSARLSV